MAFTYLVLVFGPKPGLRPRQCVLNLAAAIGVDERTALGLLTNGPHTVARGLDLGAATRLELDLASMGVACGVQAEMPAQDE